EAAISSCDFADQLGRDSARPMTCPGVHLEGWSFPPMRSRTILIALLVIIAGTTTVGAQTKYWDVDVLSVAGAGGTAPTGVWNSTSHNWNTDSTGLGIPSTWTAGNVADFAAGTNATGSYTVTVTGTQSLSGLTVEEGMITQNNGTLDFG